mmetsp:Transcript_56158/g.168094  ORF Transcript_56158/g.168094 Transcript_56158/m.168094 type:complete len:273 (-) Transcript_56158:812-1630(-)
MVRAGVRIGREHPRQARQGARLHEPAPRREVLVPSVEGDPPHDGHGHEGEGREPRRPDHGELGQERLEGRGTSAPVTDRGGPRQECQAQGGAEVHEGPSRRILQRVVAVECGVICASPLRQRRVRQHDRQGEQTGWTSRSAREYRARRTSHPLHQSREHRRGSHARRRFAREDVAGEGPSAPHREQYHRHEGIAQGLEVGRHGVEHEAPHPVPFVGRQVSHLEETREGIARARGEDHQDSHVDRVMGRPRREGRHDLVPQDRPQEGRRRRGQ